MLPFSLRDRLHAEVVTAEAEAERGTIAWRDVNDRLANGPNTAHERGALKRRRAALRRACHPRAYLYTDTDSMFLDVNRPDTRKAT
jgi:hypothetical protein